MGFEIKRVAVLGSGVMGQGIAAHLANAGIPSLLFDLTAEGDDPRAVARANIKNAAKLKPAAFFTPELAELITPCHFDMIGGDHDSDDSALLASCDWIIEVVVERLDIKRGTFAWVEKFRREGSLVSSNTSGISLAAMSEGMSEELKAHFVVTHFFNPVRYMRLLEIVSGPDTDEAAVEALVDFCERKLGKGVVYAKDTPNFIANRIGTFGIGSVSRHMERLGMSIEEVDTVFGPVMGRPKLGVFGLGDLVGLDTLVHVLANVYENCPDDERREDFKPAPWLLRMVEEGALGNKTKKGFYQRTRQRDAKGRRITLARNLETGEYAPRSFPKFKSVSKAKSKLKINPLTAVKALLAGDDKAAEIAWAVTADSLIYTANRVPEIADDIVNVDRAMRWGFNWDTGPFEAWDILGVAETVARMEAEGREVTPWVKAMLAAGRERFYARNEAGALTYWDPATEGAKLVPQRESWITFSGIRASGGQVAKNTDAELLDLGDGVLCLSLTNPAEMNALNQNLFSMYDRALTELEEGKWEALVIGAQNHPSGTFRPSVGPNGNAFCAGANLMMVGMMAAQGQWDQLEATVKGMQDLLMRAQYCPRPVVTAPFGLALGGGLELSMQAAACQTTGEVYMGLVEAGMGLLPAGGGCKEMLKRYLGDIPRPVAEAFNYDPNAFIQTIILNMLSPEGVSTSAEIAREKRYIRPTDRVSLDADALIYDAKRLALGLVAGGYEPPKKSKFKLPGPSGRSAIELQLYQFQQGGFASAHDALVGKKIAHVLTGGDIPTNTWVDEQHILDLEREGFVSLCGEPKTQERIQVFLTTGKLHRN